MIVSCKCGAKLKVDEARISGKRVKVRCPRCRNVLSVQHTAPETAPKNIAPPFSASAKHLVLIAHDSQVVRYMVSNVLTDAGFRVETASDGVDALKKAATVRPQGLVIDVGLPGIYGFEVCERLKENPATKDIKIVLLSSVYDMRRYKRTPVSLYGADDYIEKHHIPDALPAKLRKLFSIEESSDAAPKIKAPSRTESPEMSLPPAREFKTSLLSQEEHPQVECDLPASGRPAASRPKQAHGAETTAIMPESISLDASIFQKEECDIPLIDEADPEGVEKARRFARIIVSDIALYNEELVVEGIRNGTFFELLNTDVEEGRELYKKRIPAGIRAKKDYYQEAFENFIEAAKKKNVH